MGNLFDFPDPNDRCVIMGVTGIATRAERSVLKPNHVWVYVDEEDWLAAVRRGAYSMVESPFISSLLFEGKVLALVPSQAVTRA